MSSTLLVCLRLLSTSLLLIISLVDDCHLQSVHASHLVSPAAVTSLASLYEYFCSPSIGLFKGSTRRKYAFYQLVAVIKVTDSADQLSQPLIDWLEFTLNAACPEILPLMFSSDYRNQLAKGQHLSEISPVIKVSLDQKVIIPSQELKKLLKYPDDVVSVERQSDPAEGSNHSAVTTTVHYSTVEKLGKELKAAIEEWPSQSSAPSAAYRLKVRLLFLVLVARPIERQFKEAQLFVVNAEKANLGLKKESECAATFPLKRLLIKVLKRNEAFRAAAEGGQSSAQSVAKRLNAFIRQLAPSSLMLTSSAVEKEVVVTVREVMETVEYSGVLEAAFLPLNPAFELLLFPASLLKYTVFGQAVTARNEIEVMEALINSLATDVLNWDINEKITQVEHYWYRLAVAAVFRQTGAVASMKLEWEIVQKQEKLRGAEECSPASLPPKDSPERDHQKVPTSRPINPVTAPPLSQLEQQTGRLGRKDEHEVTTENAFPPTTEAPSLPLGTKIPPRGGNFFRERFKCKYALGAAAGLLMLATLGNYIIPELREILPEKDDQSSLPEDPFLLSSEMIIVYIAIVFLLLVASFLYNNYLYNNNNNDTAEGKRKRRKSRKALKKGTSSGLKSPVSYRLSTSTSAVQQSGRLQKMAIRNGRQSPKRMMVPRGQSSPVSIIQSSLSTSQSASSLESQQRQPFPSAKKAELKEKGKENIIRTHTHKP